MRALDFRIGLLLLVASSVFPASAQGPTRARPEAAPSSPSEARMRAAAEALASLDTERLDRDKAYASTIADHIVVLQTRSGLSPDQRYALQTALTFALAAADRDDAAETAANALIAMRPGSASSHGVALVAAGMADRHARYAAVVEGAARLLTDPAERSSLIGTLQPETVFGQLYAMRSANAREPRVRLAAALLRLGWPAQGESVDSGDALRMIVIDDRLARGEVAEAARLAAEVRGTGSVLLLVTGRKYDPLVGEADRVARARAAIDAEDRATAGALAAAPQDVDALVRRAAFLRAAGRDREVLDLLLPLMADPAIIVRRGERGFWLVNEAAHSLVATGVPDEGIELMRPLATMDLAQRPGLVNTSINFAALLYRTGRTQEALREAERLDRALEGFASDYGKMIVWSVAACASHELGRPAQSDGWLRRMEPKAVENRASMIEAHLCRGEVEAAERVLIAALEDEDRRGDAILWFQDWDPRPMTPVTRREAERFEQLRMRPAVQAAFARVGHRLRLPLPSTLYGF